jgi:hypothetical protein
MQTATKEPKFTKKMEQLLLRYRITLRDKDTIVTHQITGQRAKCSPVMFALFELTLKANYIGAELCPDPEDRAYFARGIQMLAARNGIELIPAASVPLPERAQADYWWAWKQIRDSGLYFVLLD